MDIAVYTIKEVAGAIVDPYLAIILLIIGLVLYKQNKKTTDMQKMIMGSSSNSPLELTISQIVLGIFAGTICSLMLSYLGVMFQEDSAVMYIFLISILLMLWKPRFICFSYSGGMLGIASLILAKLSSAFSGRIISLLGFNIKVSNIDVLNIDIVALVSMIGVLHLVEGILVLIDGKKGAIPVFTKRDDRIIGGFALQRYWVLPIVLLFIVSNPVASIGGESATMPLWWPLIKTNIPATILKSAVLALTPFYGVIGFSNITFTMDKKRKTLISGSMISIYGLILILVAQLAALGFIFSFLVLIFMPIAHEGLLIIQRYIESRGTPKYVSGDDGVMVLEVSPDSPAEEMGIRSGDKLLEINNAKIINEEEILKVIKEGVNFIWFKVKQSNGNLKDVSYNRMNSIKRLGIVFVPRGLPKDSTVVKFENTKFSDILNKIKNKDKDK